MAYVIAEPCIGTKDTACVDACPVVRLACNEVSRGSDVRQSEYVKAAGRRIEVRAERRTASDHRGRESVHVRPVPFEQFPVLPQRLRSDCVAAVDEEVHLLEA